MKNFAFVLLTGIFLSTSTSSVFAEETKIIAKTPAASNQFELVDEEKLSNVEKAFVTIAKEHKGVHKFGFLYVIAAGPKPNSGYDLHLANQEQIFEQLKMYVKQTTPEPEKSYAQVIDYPHITGRLELPKYTTLSVFDVDTKSPFADGQNFQLDFKKKQTTNYNRHSWSIKLDKKITKSELDTYKISIKKLGETEKELPVSVSLDKNKKTIRVIPRQKYESGSLYLLQVQTESKQNTKLTVLPFEMKPGKP